MIILDPHRKIKKAAMFAGIFAVIVGFLVMVFWGAQKMKPKPVDAPSAGVQKTNEEKLQQEKIQKESQKLDQIREGSGVKEYTLEEIKQQSQKLDELRDQMVK